VVTSSSLLLTKFLLSSLFWQCFIASICSELDPVNISCVTQWRCHADFEGLSSSNSPEFVRLCAAVRSLIFNSDTTA
jgi:hypothetical protein